MSAIPEERAQRPLTIGSVCRRLRDEFPDISVSKIRYLEDQGLLTPSRTAGGYRLFREEDVDRLLTILRLQRDEFLPLRVIRDELDSRTSRKRDKPSRESARDRLRSVPDSVLSLEELSEQADIDPTFAKELATYGLLEERVHGDVRGFGEDDIEIATLCGRLARYNLAPRNLRAIKTAAERQATLLEQVVAPGLRGKKPERRQRAIDDLDKLATISTELSQHLFWRALRSVARQ
ncbi:MAG: transcriptional regulator FtsR [Gaiellaceae bacterium]